MIAGDFNLIYKDEDKNKSNYNRAMMGRFRRFINDLALKKYLSMVRNLHGRTCKIHLPWSNWIGCYAQLIGRRERFPDYLLQSLSSHDSDHCPLLLGLRDNKAGKRCFHFESFWPKLDGFQEAVAAAWGSVPAGLCPFITLDLKLKAVKGCKAGAPGMLATLIHSSL